MLETIENTILEKLKEEFPAYEVDSCPTDLELHQLTSPVGCIFTRYEKSSMSNQNSVWAVNVDETYNITVFTALRYAQKHKDCYPFLTQLKSLLNGLEILNKRVQVNNLNYENTINGDIWYSLDLSIMLPLTDKYADKNEALEVLYQKQ